ncbi:MAG: oligosaccharide flippase family protein [Candidatus Paceibacterota bacterium]
MMYLVRGGSWLSVAQFAVSLSGFVLTMVLANLLSPEHLGEYRFLIAGFTLVSILALPGMRTALRESTPKGYRGNLTLAFSAMAKWGLLGSVVSLCIAAYYFIQDNSGLALGFIVIAFATPLYNAGTGYLEYLTALKKVRHTALYTTATRVVVLVATVLVALMFPHLAWVILIPYLFGVILPNLWFHFKTVREYERPGDPVDPGITRYAGHITAMTALGVVAGQLDKIFVWNFIGATALAFFYIAYTIPLAISQYLQIVPTLAFAKFGEKDPRIIRQTLLPKILKYLLVIALGVVLYIFAAPYIFMLIFPQYMAAVPYSQVLMLTTLFAAFLPIKTYLTTLKATRNLYILSVIPPAVRILVAVLLIAPFGIWGAVCSLLIEGVIRTGLLLFFFLRTPR